eukprot:GHRQ01017691.1.p2 GENE.GHRQ01017691.1~~GHRQ01017691.1.p2  ORF type:complete len:197 (+),score=38.69 GHRQ01017691.1:864-1454(+)
MQVYPAKPKEACSTVAVWLILNTTHLQAQHSIRTNPTEGATCLGHLPLLCPVVLLQEAFNARQIVPSNYVRYHAEGLKQALNDAYGVMPHITCDAQGELAEVWMCIDKKLRPVDCVDGPHPHRIAQLRHRTASPAGSATHLAGVAASAVPANFNCILVKIPELNKDTFKAAEKAAAAAVTPHKEGFEDLMRRQQTR